jgi:hypothetical protein
LHRLSLQRLIAQGFNEYEGHLLASFAALLFRRLVVNVERNLFHEQLPLPEAKALSQQDKD